MVLLQFSSKTREAQGKETLLCLFVDSNDGSFELFSKGSGNCSYQQAVSGLKIKLGKSKLLLVERIEDLEYSAYQLGCRKGTFPTKYLSMLLGTQFKSSCVWDPIEDRFKEISIPL
ncbi:hypothetical protein CK203_003568 [Vitis vinifera]|uniref:Uncharacterized protein n=1 Tax=Vitis vinifera TaxID=29760 RepID=A0A438K7Y7_VITVI|nr:hypothetical protein CK203_003568 [Vitis vinifera]